MSNNDDAAETTNDADPEQEAESTAEDAESVPEEMASTGEVNSPPEEGSPREETGDAEVASEPDQGEAATDTAHDEVYCSSCGESIKREAEVCPHCGVRQQAASGSDELNPGISAIASLVIPGAGQLYNGQMSRGAVAFIGAIVADTFITLLALVLTVILIGPLFFILIPVVHLAIAYDAYNQAEKINSGEITV